MQIANQPTRVLQLRDIDVQIHPVDAPYLEPHMLGQDISDGSGYGHDGLRSDGWPAGQQTAIYAVHTQDRSAGHRLQPTGAPKPPPAEDTTRRDGAKPRKHSVAFAVVALPAAAEVLMKARLVHQLGRALCGAAGAGPVGAGACAAPRHADRSVSGQSWRSGLIVPPASFVGTWCTRIWSCWGTSVAS